MKKEYPNIYNKENADLITKTGKINMDQYKQIIKVYERYFKIEKILTLI